MILRQIYSGNYVGLSLPNFVVLVPNYYKRYCKKHFGLIFRTQYIYEPAKSISAPVERYHVVTWKLFFSRSTSVHSALGLRDYALYKSTIDIDTDIDIRRRYC